MEAVAEFKGTPGPWGFSEWDDGMLPFGIETDKGICIAYVCEDGPRTEYTTRLIAAAPDLLLALDACETALSPVMANHECGDKPDGKDRCGECLGCMNWATWTMAKAAIKKALEGG